MGDPEDAGPTVTIDYLLLLRLRNGAAILLLVDLVPSL
jgi:hypothetical protein